MQEIYPVLHDGGICIAGGFAPQAGLVTPRVIVLDLATQSWRDAPPLPTPSHHVHLASVNGRLWAIGGFIPRPDAVWACTARVLELEGNEWKPGPVLPKPVGEAGGRFALRVQPAKRLVALRNHAHAATRPRLRGRQRCKVS